MCCEKRQDFLAARADCKAMAGLSGNMQQKLAALKVSFQMLHVPTLPYLLSHCTCLSATPDLSNKLVVSLCAVIRGGDVAVQGRLHSVRR